ncbi:FxSxx-COOH cyclophane-containing RiPP peptide [Actinokineospora iranica]|uniref:FXSXX-COOH protein n=1 Tax=Actinokineospora iranica TaxID=1271860 RepID=A0A1G6WPA2_9PSEU|nr:FxSxx-COOH cyclophane-containing RiPP peptide [Actinokineospora iranica]SDD66926.1 FXSXX-COOH protein [Actinokineospora iranica]
MDDDGGRGAEHRVHESDLLDVTDLDLDRLAALPDTVLAASLRRILTEYDAVPDRYAAFQNAI